MKRKLIFVSFAFDVQKRTGNNMLHSSETYDIYCKNFCVALVSLRKENIDCDIALVTNARIPKLYEDILNQNGIFIFIEPYEKFIFPNDFPWSLAFYKLCALNAMVEQYNYDYYCYLDADIVANQSLDGVWKEAEQHILLYDINHGFNVSDYRKFLKETQDFLGEKNIVPQYGGEFFAASRENAKKFANECLDVYNRIIERKTFFSFGDEFIISIAAERLKNYLRNAGSYIFRFWTGQFRLVSTCYEYNPVSILHMPDEKKDGIVKIFDQYIAKGRYPTKRVIYKICHLRRPKLKNVVKGLLMRIIKRK